jgi:hypothetical protein
MASHFLQMITNWFSGRYCLRLFSWDLYVAAFICHLLGDFHVYSPYGLVPMCVWVDSGPRI